MAEDQPQPQLTRKGFLQVATEMVAFNKVVVMGLLFVLLIDVAASFYLGYREQANPKSAEFVLAFFKDIALIIVGAIAGLLQNKEHPPAQ